MTKQDQESFDTFKKNLIARSEQIVTCFFMDESTDSQFEAYYTDYLSGSSLDAIIFDAVQEAYPEDSLYARRID